jgi:hypothetical protein
MPNDVKVEEHPAATGTTLHKGVGNWYLSFTGPSGFVGKIQAITKNEIGADRRRLLRREHHLVHPTADRYRGLRSSEAHPATLAE